MKGMGESLCRWVKRSSCIGAPLFFGFLLLTGCQDQEKEWRFQRSIDPNGGTLIGIAADSDQLWITDAGRKAVLRIAIDSVEERGDRFTGLQRPMHPSFHHGKLYVPEFLSDSIRILRSGNKKVGHYPLSIRPDGPSSIAFNKDRAAIADFYEHRILLRADEGMRSIGKKGNGKGELYYPTDIAFQGNELFVADAYNHRVQVFDLQGKSQRIIGASDSIQVASGIDVGKERLAVTDQKNGRVLLYDLQGHRLQVLTKKLEQPTDVLFHRGELYVTNGREGSIRVFTEG